MGGILDCWNTQQLFLFCVKKIILKNTQLWTNKQNIQAYVASPAQLFWGVYLVSEMEFKSPTSFHLATLFAQCLKEAPMGTYSRNTGQRGPAIIQLQEGMSERPIYH